VKGVIKDHEPLRITRRNGENIVLVSEEDWEREQETLYVLQSSSLMEQIAQSYRTHKKGKGYKPTDEELDEVHRI
jgi:antitoxin YefM